MTLELNGYAVVNIPNELIPCAWIVAREWDGEMWFYGAWDDENDALACAYEIGGTVIPWQG